MENLALGIQSQQYFRAKITINAYIKSYMGFRLPSKCMTLNDLTQGH